jgi:hypothetical protein
MIRFVPWTPRDRCIVGLAILCWLLDATHAFGQTTQPALPTSVEILVLPPTGDPLTVAPIATRTTLISATSARCNLATTANPTGTLTNPTKVRFTDPFTTGRQCEADLPAGLPNGTGYRAVAVPVAPDCVIAGTNITVCRGQRSQVAIPSPFDVVPVLGPPTILTGVGLRP